MCDREPEYTGYILQYTGYNFQYTGYNFQYTGYNLQYTGYNLQYTGYNLQPNFHYQQGPSFCGDHEMIAKPLQLIHTRHLTRHSFFGTKCIKLNISDYLNCFISHRKSLNIQHDQTPQYLLDYILCQISTHSITFVKL